MNLNALGSFKEKLKHRITTPKGVSPEMMQQIESFDRMLLTKREQLYLDLFLFSYYAGGMSAIDVCYLPEIRSKTIRLSMSILSMKAGTSHHRRQSSRDYGKIPQ